MEILYLGGFKQTALTAGIFVICSELRYKEALEEVLLWLPQKKCYPQKWLRQKCWRTLLRGGLLLHFGKMAYFIAYGFPFKH